MTSTISDHPDLTEDLDELWRRSGPTVEELGLLARGLRLHELLLLEPSSRLLGVVRSIGFFLARIRPGTDG